MRRAKSKIMKELIEGLQIFLKYTPRNLAYEEYDILHIIDIEAKDVSEPDKARLKELGFFEFAESEGFVSYRGSFQTR